ncbi:MAG: CRTAC1 family protein [Phycisphaerales bacterium]|nr:CRTAC1 family protein [Phycisphaerales bacterium]
MRVTGRKDKRKRLLARWGLLSLVFTAAVGGVIAATGLRLGEAVPGAGAQVAGLTSVLARDVGTAAVPIRFEEVAAAMGVNFTHMPSGRASLLPEDMGSGVACGDFDGDGFVDLYFVNFSGQVTPGAPLDAVAGRAKLFRNVRGESFVDVTDSAGVGHVGHGMGAAWGDCDNDGDLDLYVTAFGPNVLYENMGDGTFVDATAQRGVQDARFSSGCSWADYDRDGDLDLYVCNYVDFVYRNEDRGMSRRQYETEQPYTLNPSSYPPEPNSLFRNRGDGTFEEVAAQAGVADPSGRSLSASWVDLNNDGWGDLYVANDVSKNGVFLNLGNGAFQDIGASSLAADYRGAMGIAVADFDNDLDQDLMITHWLAQENAMFRNMTIDPAMGDGADGRVWFMDDADQVGFGQISLDMVGWAAGFCDLDNDGLRDAWVVNGSTLEDRHDTRRLVAQKPFVFWNRGSQGYVEVAARASTVLDRPIVGRGGAQVDFDKDGRMDLIVAVHGGEPLVLRNTSAKVGHWVRVLLRQVGGNTRALGARVYVSAGGTTQMAEVGASSSYLSQDDLAVHFGVGAATQVESLRIVWPDGAEEVHRGVAVDRSWSFEHEGDYSLTVYASPRSGIQRELLVTEVAR